MKYSIPTQPQVLKVQEEMKGALNYFLRRKGIDIYSREIRYNGSWPLGEFSARGRSYKVDALRHTLYSDEWYCTHEYGDYNGYRVSVNYLFNSWKSGKARLSIGYDDVYIWNENRKDYPKMNAQELDTVVDKYFKEYLTNRSNDYADTSLVRRAIQYELGRHYLKPWFID